VVLIFAVSFNPGNFLTVDDCNMDECLKSSSDLVNYQVSGEPGIAGYSHCSGIYLRGVRLCASLLYVDHHCAILFFVC